MVVAFASSDLAPLIDSCMASCVLCACELGTLAGSVITPNAPLHCARVKNGEGCLWLRMVCYMVLPSVLAATLRKSASEPLKTMSQRTTRPPNDLHEQETADSARAGCSVSRPVRHGCLKRPFVSLVPHSVEPQRLQVDWVALWH